MKRLKVAAAFLSVLFVAASATTQQKLGDVAGSIKLNTSGEQSVVIDGSDVGQTSRRSTSASSSDLLYEVLTECLDISRALSSMIAESPRIKPARYTEGWRTELGDIGARLESVALELGMLPDAGPFEAAYLKAVGGFDQVRQGYEAVVTATDGRMLVTSQMKRTVSDGGDTIEEAMTEMRAVERSQAAIAEPPGIDPVAAAASIRKVCSRQGAEGSQTYRDCVNLQDAARDALVARTAPSVGLDAASFNKIRNGCLYEWPDSYLDRDACEVQRSAAKAGG